LRVILYRGFVAYKIGLGELDDNRQFVLNVSGDDSVIWVPEDKVQAWIDMNKRYCHTGKPDLEYGLG
jgi:hypothetical protein